MEELKERQQIDEDKLDDLLNKQARKEEDKAMADFEVYRQRALREVKNRQAAELSARSDLSSDEMQQVWL